MWPEPEIPVERYFELQGRFAPLLADAATIDRARSEVDQRWEALAQRHHEVAGVAARR